LRAIFSFFRFFFFSFLRFFLRLRSSRFKPSTKARSEDALVLFRFASDAAMGSSLAMRAASNSTLPVVASGHSLSPVRWP